MSKKREEGEKFAKKKQKIKKQRLYSRALVIGAKRSRHKQKPTRTIVQIEGVKEKTDTPYYIGKKVAFMFGLPEGAKKNKSPENYLEGKRVIWGEVTRHHGNNGNVQVKFDKNLPGWCQGMKCRVYMYPSTD